MISYLPLGIGSANPTADVTLHRAIPPPTLNRDSLDSMSDYDAEAQLSSRKPQRGFAPGRRKKVKWTVVLLAVVLVVSFVASGFFPAPRRQGLVGDVGDGSGEGHERVEGKD